MLHPAAGLQHMGERSLFLMKCHEMQLWGGGLEEVLMGWEGRHVYGIGRGGGVIEGWKEEWKVTCGLEDWEVT